MGHFIGYSCLVYELATQALPVGSYLLYTLCSYECQLIKHKTMIKSKVVISRFNICGDYTVTQ